MGFFGKNREFVGFRKGFVIARIRKSFGKPTNSQVFPQNTQLRKLKSRFLHEKIIFFGQVFFLFRISLNVIDSCRLSGERSIMSSFDGGTVKKVAVINTFTDRSSSRQHETRRLRGN